MKKFKKFFTLLGLLIILSYQTAVIYYSHFHIVNNLLIVHYHNYDKSEPQQHTHTAEEYAKIAFIYHYIVVPLAAAVTIPLLLILLDTLYRQEIISPLRRIYHRIAGRGPPAFYLFQTAPQTVSINLKMQ